MRIRSAADEGRSGLQKIESAATHQGSPTLNGDANGDGHEISKLEESPKPHMAQAPKHQEKNTQAEKQLTIVVPPPTRPITGEIGADTNVATNSSMVPGGAKESGDKANGDQIDTKRRRAGSGSERMQALSEKFSKYDYKASKIRLADSIYHADAGALSEAWATVEDSDHLDDFAPHVLHKPHKPFPVAMANRKPHGCEWHTFDLCPRNHTDLPTTLCSTRSSW